MKKNERKKKKENIRSHDGRGLWWNFHLLWNLGEIESDYAHRVAVLMALETKHTFPIDTTGTPPCRPLVCITSSRADDIHSYINMHIGKQTLRYSVMGK